MCTVTFLPRKHGYALAMNRDEKLTRIAGLPPQKATINGRTVLAPAEPAGGTWISLNDSGVTFALINWYSIPAQARANPVSRGEVVRSASQLDSPDSVSLLLEKLPLANINPFRLIGIFPSAQKIFQWQWDLQKLVCKPHRWLPQQWISSGFDEPAAMRIRNRTFRQALKQKSAGRLDWLHRLHSSHTPQAGPFSICMHRTDAKTVSCTEVVVARQNAMMRHRNGTPCECPATSNQQLRRIHFQP